ncbi:Polyamine transporter 4 [Cladobotryum mycophilum]|uniref:Polyamine transporter 4 n=1 Tax=Cladobotryum mycophilum TaxID=491253 RepID=A0ABR0SBB2_9HYPO
MVEVLADDSATMVEREVEDRRGSTAVPSQNEQASDSSDAEKAMTPDDNLHWDHDPRNPYNWPGWKKASMVVMMSCMAITASIATSIMSSSRGQLQEEFGVSRTVALLPLTFYVLALGFGPVIGGPLSETIGRYPIYYGSMPLGALFTLGAGFTHSFAALCVLRFLAGFCWAPVLSVAPGSMAETFMPKSRGPISAVFILMPFLGPGLGPVIGSFVVTIKGWRWTQWTLIFFSILCILLIPLSEETFHPIIRRRIAKKRGEELPHHLL